MITFAPTICQAVLPGMHFVTQFENVMGWLPDRCSFVTRCLHKALRSWIDGANFEFGTLLKDSDRIIVLSNKHQSLLIEQCSSVSDKSLVIPPPPLMHISPDTEAARRRGRLSLGVNHDDFLVAYFGYIYPHKGVETLLRAFQVVRLQRKNVRLVLIGGIIALKFPHRPSYEEEVRELSRNLGIDDLVIWTGEYAWDSDEASTYLHAADVCVLPFDKGVQLNNSSFSAVAVHGLPIVTTQDAMTDSTFVHKKNVYLCPPKSPEAIATALMKLMDDPHLRKQLHMGAHHLSREWFSWDTVLGRTLAAFS
jgi:glycosyltransferase involved in cell wall biosynthesis